MKVFYRQSIQGLVVRGKKLLTLTSLYHLHKYINFCVFSLITHFIMLAGLSVPPKNIGKPLIF